MNSLKNCKVIVIGKESKIIYYNSGSQPDVKINSVGSPNALCQTKLIDYLFMLYVTILRGSAIFKLTKEYISDVVYNEQLCTSQTCFFIMFVLRTHNHLFQVSQKNLARCFK